VLTDYYRLTRAEAMPPVVTVRSLPNSEPSPGPWIAAVAILIAIAITYWLLVSRPFSPEAPLVQPAPAVPAGQVLREEPPQEDAGNEADAGAEETAPAPEPREPVDDDAELEPDSTADLQPAIEEAAPQRDAVQQGTVALQITFNGDCWTEISDATGRRLFFNLGQAGRTVTVTGQEPLSVLFGDADNVSLVVNGNEFTIADADRRGRTARFLLFGS
jgi:cytoskeleton protein RodZ